MTIRVLTVCDESYAGLARVALSSIGAWSGRKDASFTVYDLGLRANSAERMREQGYRLADLVASLPANPWVLDRRFVVMLSIPTAISQEAERALASGQDDLIVFFAADMVVNGPGKEQFGALLTDPSDGVMAVPDPFRFGNANAWMYVRGDASSPKLWRKWFGKDLSEARTWNTGLVAGRASVLAEFCRVWLAWISRWVHDPAFHDDFRGDCLDQLAFSLVAEASLSDVPIVELPPSMNFTRIYWTLRPDEIASALALHLTGPIKPWQSGAQLHPMTIRWMELAEALG